MASYGNVTTQRLSEDFTTKNKITLRDGVLILLGAMGMYGTQLATQYGMRSDIRDFGTKFDSYVSRQMETNSTVQRQIDEWRGQTKLNTVDIGNARSELSELKGMLLGAGIKGVSNGKR